MPPSASLQKMKRGTSTRKRTATNGKEVETAAAAASSCSTEQVLLALIKAATTPPPASTAVQIMEGESEDDKKRWTELKMLLRGGNDALAKQAFAFLLGQLRDRRPRVRLRALLLLDRLVMRSGTVRAELAIHIRDVLDTCVGSSRAKLPEPKEESALLKDKALEVLEVWHKAFAGQHPELRVAYLHLKDVVGVAFPNRQAQQEEEAHRKQTQAAERARSLAARYRVHRDAMVQGALELRDILNQMEGCFDVIVPDMRKGLEALGEAVDNADEKGGEARGKEGAIITPVAPAQEDIEHDGDDDAADDDSVEWESGDEGGEEDDEEAARLYSSSDEDGRLEEEEVGLHGLGKSQFYEIEVELPWLQAAQQLETPDLKPVFDQLRELYGVLQGRLLPQAEQWWRLLAACVQRPGTLGAEQVGEDAACRSLLEEMGTLRKQAAKSVAKCDNIGGSRQQHQQRRRKKRRKRTNGMQHRALSASTVELQSFLDTKLTATSATTTKETVKKEE